nr:ionotropic receptor [Semanotus bifasciatus]
MHKLSLIWTLAIVFVFPLVSCRKNITIGIFIDEDDKYELSLAISTAVHQVNVFSKTEYLIKPVVYTIQRTDILKAGEKVCELVEKGVAAIFGPESPEINEIIQSVALSLEIPQFQTFWNPRLSSFASQLPSDKSTTVFNLYPSAHTLSKAIATLVKENDWKSYTVIYENDDGLLRLQGALNQRNPTDPPVIFRKLGEKTSYRSVLKEIKSSAAQHFILDCSVDHILDILREAKELKLLLEYYSYILTNLDSHTLDWSDFKDVQSNITAFRVLNTSGPVVIAAQVFNQILTYPIADYTENDIIRKQLGNLRYSQVYPEVRPNKIRAKTALLYDALNVFVTVFSEEDAKEELVLKPLSCEKLETSSHGSRISEAVMKVNMERGLLRQPLCGPINSFTKYGQRISYQFELIELELELRRKGFHRKDDFFRPIATWNTEEPNKMHYQVTSKTREHELKEIIQQTTFRVVSRIGPPYLMWKPNPDKKPLSGNDRFEGYAMDLMHEICKPRNLNCSYNFELVPDGKYGMYNPKTKQWDGLIRELLERRAELAICDLTITYERRKAVDFTMPFMTLGISILYSKAVKEPPELLSFSHPLSLDVWLYMATAYLVISMIIFLVARLNPNDWENPHPCNNSPTELENIWNIKNCFWLTLGSIMAQGCDILPKGISTRMVTSMWWFFSLIMTACYTANLAAFLTMERLGPTIESAADLAAQTRIKYGCVKDASTASFFQDSNFSTYHRMWVQMESANPSVFEKNNGDGVKRVLNNKRNYAFLMESSSIEYEMERNCELMQVGNTLDSKGYGIAMPTNARYRKSINEVILKLQEMGVLHELKTRWWKERNGGGQCEKDDRSGDETATELGLDHVGGVFVVLAVGICIALTIAICEFLWNVRKVAVVERLTVRDAFNKELKFALDIRARKKAVLPSASGEKSIEKLGGNT